MLKEVRLFIANLRTRLFEEVLEWEIYHKIFPHVRNEVDNGYPFKTRAELVHQNAQSPFTICEQLREFEDIAARMPEAYAESYRHIVYRDIDTRMKKYLALAKQRSDPSEVPPVPVKIPA